MMLPLLVSYREAMRQARTHELRRYWRGVVRSEQRCLVALRSLRPENSRPAFSGTAEALAALSLVVGGSLITALATLI